MAKKPPAKDKKDTPRFDDAQIADLIDARDVAALTAALEAGLDPAWTDTTGRGLAHFAALWGDAAAFDAFTARGVAAVSYDGNGETPEHLARALGHDALAYKITRLPPPPAITETGYASLADIRRASRENLSDHFGYLVQKGGLDALIALARRETGAEALCAADLLARGSDGDTALLKICQQGALGKLLDVDLWKDRPDEFSKLWQAVPQDYAKAHDAEAFLAAAHQAQLQSYVQPDFSLGRRPPKTANAQKPQSGATAPKPPKR
ncbi:MAG: hypothetical protein Q8K65_02210 [Alphaproteobacteria bacterium]|nr:hypothetical protein [Alphaproteobacteria bacterium]